MWHQQKKTVKAGARRGSFGLVGRRLRQQRSLASPGSIVYDPDVVNLGAPDQHQGLGNANQY